MTRKLSDQQKIDAVTKYLTGDYNCPQLAKEYGINRHSMWAMLKRRVNIRSSPSELQRKYALDQTFFDVIDTEAKAYFLGLMYADGYNDEQNTHFKISLQEGDEHILQKFNEFIGSNRPIKFTFMKKKSVKYKNKYCLEASSAHMSKRLKELGCHQRKSLTLKFPTESQVPHYLVRHFVRGYFDGDGSFSTFYEKHGWKVFDFNIVSTEDFCKVLQEIILKETGAKLGIGLPNKNKKDKPTRKAKCGGRIQVYKILDWLYDGATIYLKRKHDKYLEHRRIAIAA